MDAKNFPKTVVYAKLKWCGVGYEMVYREATRNSNQEGIIKAVSQYHAHCIEEVSILY